MYVPWKMGAKSRFAGAYLQTHRIWSHTHIYMCINIWNMKDKSRFACVHAQNFVIYIFMYVCVHVYVYVYMCVSSSNSVCWGRTYCTS